jgi:hypothetical protein
MIYRDFTASSRALMQAATKPAGTHRTDQQLLNTVAQAGDTETSVPSNNLVNFINKLYILIDNKSCK